MFARFASLGLALALTLALADVACAQDDRERARAEFQRGVEAFGRDDFQTALDAFQEAYRLAPHPSVRVNIANCYERLNRPIEALFHFEHFLSEAERPTPQQRREVQAAITRLEQLVGHIQLQVTPDGAMVTIDGGETRRSPVIEPVRVTAGRHTVDIRLDGFVPEHQTVEVQGGQTARVTIRLQRPGVASAGTTGAGTAGGATSTTGSGATGSGTTGAGTSTVAASTGATSTGATSTGATSTGATETTTEAAATGETGTTTTVATTTTEETAEQPSSGGGAGFVLATPTIIAGAVTIAAAIGAAITGGLALSANSDFDRQVAIVQDPSSSPDVREQARIDGESAASDARTLAVVTDVMLVTTIVGAGATAFFLITTQDGGLLASGEHEAASSTGPRMVAVPIVTGDVAGVSLVGTF